MPANRQDTPSFFGNVNLFTNLTGTPSYTQQVKTIGESQATPAQTSTTENNNSPAPAPDSAGVGAGTTNNATTSVNADDNPTPTGPTTQFAVNQSTSSLNSYISTQPNQLDQYASYTYSISWFVLTPSQYNAAIDSHQPNLAGWQLLMQSGGAPTKGRSPAFPVDYYMDDLEIESNIPFGGVPMANSANKIRFKVTEPNGITLIQKLYEAVVGVYKNAQQAGTTTSTNGNTPNYVQAQYCLVVEFYGYDSQGKLAAPARGSNSGYDTSAVIAKYYPFRIMDIKFQIANRAIEYIVTGTAIPYSYNSSTDRGTIPFAFNMTGQTVDQLLNGKVIAVADTTSTADPGTRKDTPAPNQGIAPAAFVAPIQASGGINQNQADTLNLLSAGQLGA
jgi:hypothetical protein